MYVREAVYGRIFPDMHDCIYAYVYMCVYVNMYVHASMHTLTQHNSDVQRVVAVAVPVVDVMCFLLQQGVQGGGLPPKHQPVQGHALDQTLRIGCRCRC